MRLFAIAMTMLAAMAAVAGAQPAPPIPFPGVAPEVLPPRLALLVGVQRYRDAGAVQLNNLDTTSDVDSMAELLDKLKFKTTVVTGPPNSPLVNKTDIQRAISDFVTTAKTAREQAKRNPIILFYFAGHGFNIEGKNYLLPSDFYADALEDVDGNALDVLKIVAALSSATPALQIIVTDSCRSQAPPALRRRSDDEIVTATTNGMHEPNKSRTAPQREEPGKNRTIFLYSTLDQQAAFGEPAGGRFTRALKKAFTQTLDEVTQNRPTRRSLRDIFDRAKYAMAMSNGKWQRPQMDESWGAPYYPLPTEDDFTLEGKMFELSKKVPALDFQSARDRAICNMRNMLEAFSEFSYFSDKIIQEINSRPSYLPELDCDQANSLGGGSTGIATPPTRAPDGRLEVPGVVGPASTPVPSDGPPASRSPRMQTPNSVAPDGRPSRTLLLFPPSSPKLTDGSVGPRAEARTRLAQAIRPAGNSDGFESSKPSQGAVSDEPPLRDNDIRTTESNRLSRDTKSQVEAKPTFGEVEQLTKEVRGATPDLQLDPAVPLDKAVVAKQNVFLRSAASGSAPALAVIPAGQLLEVIGTSQDRSWIQVRSDKNVGYVSGEFVEAALVKLSKAISFDAKTFELSERSKTELAAAFGALGGVLIVDAAVDYPVSEAQLGFARATLASQFIQTLAVSSEMSSNASRLFISVRPVASDKIEANTVRATILSLPLDRKTRAALAQVSRSGQPIVVDLNAVDPTNSGGPDLKYCNLNGSNCARPSASGSPNVVFREMWRNSESGSAPIAETIKKVQGLIKF
jgi:hypothetical protein